MIMSNGDSKEGYFDNNLYRGSHKDSQPIIEEMDEGEMSGGPKRRYNSVMRNQ